MRADNGFSELSSATKEAARALLAKAVSRARTMEPPGDGALLIFEDDSVDGYLLQSSYVHDTRFHPLPRVVVHVYKGGPFTTGWTDCVVEYTREDRSKLDLARLERLEETRRNIDAQIAQLRAGLAGEKPEGT